MENWRLIRDIPRNAASNLSLDEILLRKVNDNEVFNILKFNYFSPPAVILGLNQNIEELNIKYIRNQRFQINRRLTGGAAILIGYPEAHSQMGISFYIRLIKNIPRKLSEKFKYFAETLMKSLEKLNLKPTYAKNSDILVNGRKIVGNGIYIMDNALLFHSVLLLEFDFSITSQILKPIDVSFIEEDLIPTSFKNEIRKDQSYKALENTIIETLENEWNINFIEEELSDTELKSSEQLKNDKYGKKNYIFQKSEDLADFGSCFIPSPDQST